MLSNSALLRAFARPRVLVLAALVLAVAIPGVIWLRAPRSSPYTTRVAKGAVPRPAYDLQGNPVDPLAQADGRAVVLVFLGIDCPISNGYAPEIRRLHDEYSPKGVRIWVVYPDADTPAHDILQHQAEYQLPPDVLRDPSHSLAALSQASVTPEAAVFLPGGRLVYHGRIDDRHLGLGRSRPEATKHDLRDLLRRIVRGEAVSPSSTRAVGCYISRVK
jgi:hypothetical protein